jgi:hypothetical protein
VRAQIELFEHSAFAGVDENNIIGEIVSDQQLVGRAVTRDHREPRRIGYRCSVCSLANAICDLLASSNLLRRNFYKAVPRQLGVTKTVDRDPVSGVARLLTGWVRDGTD